MRAALLLAAFLVVPAAARAACYDSDCKLGCCRQSGDGAPCYCSACCLVESAAWRDERAQVYTDGRRTAAVYRFRIEFFDLRGLRPAIEENGGALRVLGAADAGWGRVSFVDSDGRRAAAAPVARRSFSEGIYPFTPRYARSSAFLVCTDRAWGVSKASAAAAGFCGALSLRGRELFRVEEAEAGGVVREPVGLSADADEALFALTRERADGGREVAGYRVWRRGKGTRALPPDSPDAKSLLERYEGTMLLPSLETGSPRR